MSDKNSLFKPDSGTFDALSDSSNVESKGFQARPKFQPNVRGKGAKAKASLPPKPPAPSSSVPNRETGGGNGVAGPSVKKEFGVDAKIDGQAHETMDVDDAGAEAVPVAVAPPKVEPQDGSAAAQVKDMEIDGTPDFSVKVEEEGAEEKPSIGVEPTLPEQDRVIREIDVYFTPCVDPETKVYIMQYPLRPNWRPYGLEERCQEVRVKAKQSRVEVDLVTDTEGENYDHGADEHLKITKQTLTSSKTPLSTGYAIGILRGNKVHLTPVQAAVQLRPSMNYLDKAMENLKKSKRTVDVDGDMGGTEKGKEKAAESTSTLVQVEVKRETERQEQMRLQSHAHFKKMDEAEPWIPLEPYGPDSLETNELLQKIVSAEQFQIPFSMNPYDYVNSLAPGRTTSVSDFPSPKTDMANEDLSRSVLDKLPLEQRFQVLLSKGKLQVLQFDNLMRFSSAGCSEQDVLEVLQQYAHLVQGCWVPASFLRYKGDICKVRDYILLLFHKNRIIRYEELDQIQLPKEMLREVLVSLAIEKRKEGCWEFREATDNTFIRHNPNVCKEQNERWLENEEGIKRAAFSVSLGKQSIQKLKTAQSEGSRGTTKSTTNISSQATRSTGPGEIAGVAGRTMSEETIAALPGVLREILANRVCNLQEICQSLRNLAKARVNSGNKKAAAAAIAAAKGASAPVAELTAVINQVASNINGVYFLTSLGNPAVDRFRDVVIKLLRTRGPGVALRKADITEACKIAFGSEVSSAIYNKVMKELCTSKGGGWVLKTGDGRPE